MLTQILVSDETLAEVFVETDAELSFQKKIEDGGAIATEGKVTALFDAFPGEFSNDFKKSADTRFSPKTAQAAYTESENVFTRAWQWVTTTFRGAKDRIVELAKKIQQEAVQLGVSIAEFLARMRRRIYRWLIRNSAIESFDVGNDLNTRRTFKPNVITTKGNFEFGRIDKDFGTLADIVGFLKIMPTISVGIDVQYGL